ncbi:Transposon Ty3-I Gag-Pol polyprotein [Thelohanellus kitauei]|uniref:Transposon Ty3-I Gag-Pol polyprotein n=1 Tax=Thelohanellus kitauei TaxID=669202 RepID=A0A0C2MG13_THEKT|nr:Transposon Ty3-I Gag-Pol polyprotein [Thelohanellus kitauei]
MVKPEKHHIHKQHISYFEKRGSISIEEDLMMWNDRIVIPIKTRRNVLKWLYEGHCGISGMKSMARPYVWWPHISHDIEELVKTCHSCQPNGPNLVAIPLNPWNSASYPLERVHIGFTGPVNGQTWLVLIDAFTQWIEVYTMPRINFEHLMNSLYDFVSRFGIPKVIVSDNGKQFYSSEYIEFCKKKSIKII